MITRVSRADRPHTPPTTTTSAPIAPPIAPIALAIALVAAGGALMLSASACHLGAGVFTCRHGETCPNGTVCDLDLGGVCVAPGVTVHDTEPEAETGAETAGGAASATGRSAMGLRTTCDPLVRVMLPLAYALSAAVVRVNLILKVASAPFPTVRLLIGWSLALRNSTVKPGTLPLRV